MDIKDNIMIFLNVYRGIIVRSKARGDWKLVIQRYNG